eukprot:1135431-Pleurochrysis_carterae.AAC.1
MLMCSDTARASRRLRQIARSRALCCACRAVTRWPLAFAQADYATIGFWVVVVIGSIYALLVVLLRRKIVLATRVVKVRASESRAHSVWG